jgi:hypothetical protein
VALIGSRQQLEWVGDEGYGGSSAPPTNGPALMTTCSRTAGRVGGQRRGPQARHTRVQTTRRWAPHTPHTCISTPHPFRRMRVSPQPLPHTHARVRRHTWNENIVGTGVGAFIKRTGGRFSKKADRPSMPSGDARWSASRRAVSAIKSPVMSCSKAFAPPPSSEAQGAKAGNTAGRVRAVDHPPAQPRRE